MDNDYRCRMESESSVGDDFDGMEPMSFDDLFISYTNFNQEPNKGDRNDSDSSLMEDPKVNLFSVAMSLRRKEKGCNLMPLELRLLQTIGISLELVSKELNPLVAILHVYAEGLNFMK